MKTKMVTPAHIDEIIASRHLSATRLSDNAFYLIVLASLLKKTVEPDALKRLLTPVIPITCAAKRSKK